MKRTTGDSTEQLVELGLNDTREGLRWQAVAELGDKPELLTGLLDDRAPLNWAKHALLLDNIADKGVKPRDWRYFLEVDNLSIAVACARLARLG